MKKLLAQIAILATIIAPLVLPLAAEAAVLPNWNLTGTWTFDDIYLGTHYLHTMVITSFNPATGAFSGTGFYNADPSLTWTVSGVESGNNITVFNLLVLTGAPGVTLAGTGAINSSGTLISGQGYQSNLSGSNPNIAWTATGAATPVVNGPTNKDQCKKDGWKTFTNPSFKNQGQCVSYVEHLPVVVPNPLKCFDGTTDGGYGGTCAISNNIATLSNNSSNVNGDYAGVYSDTSIYSGNLLSSITQLGYTYSGNISPTPGNLSLNFAVDENNDGTLEAYAYVDAYYCSGIAGVVDVINNPACGIWYQGLEYANWAALVAAYPTARVNITNVPFIVAERTPAESSAVWTISSIHLGQ